ncbi:MAG: hypothetical protein ACQETH_06130 [Candidatus Rifleibacteriota bacterium]
MSSKPDDLEIEEIQEDSKQIEWNRIAALVAAVAVLFIFTRSTPFPSTTFWDLMLARDFDLSIGAVIFPESIALNIVNSSASLLGLKAIYHIAYFLLCCILCIWVFKSREILPGLIVLGVFALSMQLFLSFRMLLQLIFVLGLLTLLDNNRLKNNFGILLIPITAAASALTLNSWLLLILIACHAFFNKNYSLSLVVCGLIGVLFFPEGAAISVNPNSVLNWQFMPIEDIKIMYLLSGIFVLVNLITLGRLTYDDMPNLVFYAITGFIALISPLYTPVFILMGAIMLLKSLSDIEPMSLNYQLGGIIVLTAIIHLFLFVNPFGFKLNPSVRGQLGKNLAPILEGYVNEQKVYNHELGEIAWKGLINLNTDDLQKVIKYRNWKLIRLGNGEFKAQPQMNFKAIDAPEVFAPDKNSGF